MTAQISDSIEYRNQTFAIAGKNGTGLFDPSEHGMNPVGICTACWRGYVCHYAVANGELQLDEISLSVDDPAPKLFGKSPRKQTASDPIFSAQYSHLQHPIPFTGGLLLADDFIEELYVHMGFHPAWKFRDVHELIFENGKLTRETDRSQQIAEFRDELSNRALRPDDETSQAEIEKWIERCFSREYRW